MRKGKFYILFAISFLFLLNYTIPVHAERQNNFELCATSDNEKEDVFLYRLYNEDYDTWLEIKNKECKQLSLDLGEYDIELIPTLNYEVDELSGIDNESTSFSIDNTSNKKITIKYSSIKNNFLIRNGNKKNKLNGEEIIEFTGFQPSIAIEILNGITNFKKGDIVHFAITVTNNENFVINNILVEEKLDNITILENDNYTIESNKLVRIKRIGPLENTKIYVDYEVREEDVGLLNNEVTLISADSETGSKLREGNIRDEKSFNVGDPKAIIKICKNSNSSNSNDIFTFYINSSTSYETWVELKSNECKELNVDYGIYNIIEIEKAGYNLIGIEGLDENGNININEQKEYIVLFNNKKNNEGFLYGFGYAKNTLNGA